MSNTTVQNIQAAARRMAQDPDIQAEAAALARISGASGAASSPAQPETSQQAQRAAAQHATVLAAVPASAGDEPRDALPLNVSRGTHRASPATAALLSAVGGRSALVRFTNAFYRKAFQDPQLDPFIRSHDDPHGERFASWIAEKMGAGQPWSEERATRRVCPFHAHGQTLSTPHDRSSAHYAAWHSPKRSDAKFGNHFKLDDCRVWMRLHFWAAREAGFYDTSAGRRWMDYYVRFIAHFVSVYERTAPPFAREAARWSADPANTAAYLERGRTMPDVVGVSLNKALATLPPEEREYTGSSARTLLWPYEL